MATIPIKETAWVEPKYWQDLTADEKIERLREEIKSRDRSANELRREFRILLEQFKQHSHNGLGLSVVPPNANQDNYGSLSAKTAGGKEYF
jgi:hypothetical protein